MLVLVYVMVLALAHVLDVVDVVDVEVHAAATVIHLVVMDAQADAQEVVVDVLVHVLEVALANAVDALEDVL